MSSTRGVLYIATCATPAASHIGKLIDLAQQSGWTTCLLVTPNALNFVDAPALEKQTGYPVRCHYRRPDETSPFPKADAMILAGASFNTMNKWALGIADTLVLSTVIEVVGMGMPVVALPFFNDALATHIAWRRSIDTLRQMGVTVLVSPESYEPHPASQSSEILGNYPWHLALAAAEKRITRSAAPPAES
jgi:phosphopantothenoylcysteine synthetase/decarboxylase